MSSAQVPSTGAIISRAPDASGVEQITAAVTMTADEWDRHTSCFAGFGFSGDMPLEKRIGTFLAVQVSCWKSLHDSD